MAGDRTSKSQEKRKSSKPLMEKRRRARINECLSELQEILEAANNGHAEMTGGHSKREKAEILEQTVQMVRHLHHQDQSGIPSEPLPQAQYRAGFNECLAEVGRFMESNNSALNTETHAGLLNHLAGSLGARAAPAPACYNGWGGQFGPGAGKAVPREVVVSGRPVLDRRGCTAVPPTPVQPQHSLRTPPVPKVSVPPLVPAPPPTTPSICSPAASTNAIPVQQSPRKGEHPTAACVPALTPGVALPVNLPSAPAGHVALVLPAHLLGSFVGGQFATGQVIPLYQHQGGSPVIQQQQQQQPAPASGTSVVLPAGSNGVGGALSSPAPGHGAKLDNQCATSSSNVGAGQIFIVPSPNFGCSPATAPSHGRPEASSYSLNLGRGIPVPVPNPPTAPTSLVAMETRSQNGVVYAPVSLPMQLYVAPSAYSGGAGGPFANGLSLPNPSPLGLGPHWRPWGWDPDKR